MSKEKSFTVVNGVRQKKISDIFPMRKRKLATDVNDLADDDINNPKPSTSKRARETLEERSKPAAKRLSKNRKEVVIQDDSNADGDDEIENIINVRQERMPFQHITAITSDDSLTEPEHKPAASNTFQDMLPPPHTTKKAAENTIRILHSVNSVDLNVRFPVKKPIFNRFIDTSMVVEQTTNIILFLGCEHTFEDLVSQQNWVDKIKNDFYLAFYIFPIIRERLRWKIKTKISFEMKAKLLSIPKRPKVKFDEFISSLIETEHEEESLSATQEEESDSVVTESASNDVNTSQTVETALTTPEKTPAKVGKQHNESHEKKSVPAHLDESNMPVAFETFKSYLNLNEIVDIFLRDKYKDSYHEKLHTKPFEQYKKICEKYFYGEFYTVPLKRLKWPYKYLKLKRECSKPMKIMLYDIPQEYRDNTLPACILRATDRTSIDSILPLITDKLLLECFPVTFATFKKYVICKKPVGIIVRYIERALQAEEWAILTKNTDRFDAHVIRFFFEQYYTEQYTRDFFIVKFNPCPQKFKEKLCIEPNKVWETYKLRQITANNNNVEPDVPSDAYNGNSSKWESSDTNRSSIHESFSSRPISPTIHTVPSPVTHVSVHENSLAQDHGMETDLHATPTTAFINNEATQETEDFVMAEENECSTEDIESQQNPNELQQSAMNMTNDEATQTTEDFVVEREISQSKRTSNEAQQCELNLTNDEATQTEDFEMEEGNRVSNKTANNSTIESDFLPTQPFPTEWNKPAPNLVSAEMIISPLNSKQQAPIVRESDVMEIMSQTQSVTAPETQTIENSTASVPAIQQNPIINGNESRHSNSESNTGKDLEEVVPQLASDSDSTQQFVTNAGQSGQSKTQQNEINESLSSSNNRNREQIVERLNVYLPLINNFAASFPKCPIRFETFETFLANADEVVSEIVENLSRKITIEDFLEFSDELDLHEHALRYIYEQYYSNPEIRSNLKLTFKPAPKSLQAKLNWHPEINAMEKLQFSGRTEGSEDSATSSRKTQANQCNEGGVSRKETGLVQCVRVCNPIPDHILKAYISKKTHQKNVDAVLTKAKLEYQTVIIDQPVMNLENIARQSTIFTPRPAPTRNLTDADLNSEDDEGDELDSVNTEPFVVDSLEDTVIPSSTQKSPELPVVECPESFVPPQNLTTPARSEVMTDATQSNTVPPEMDKGETPNLLSTSIRTDGMHSIHNTVTGTESQSPNVSNFINMPSTQQQIEMLPAETTVSDQDPLNSTNVATPQNESIAKSSGCVPQVKIKQENIATKYLNNLFITIDDDTDQVTYEPIVDEPILIADDNETTHDSIINDCIGLLENQNNARPITLSTSMLQDLHLTSSLGGNAQQLPSNLNESSMEMKPNEQNPPPNLHNNNVNSILSNNPNVLTIIPRNALDIGVNNNINNINEAITNTHISADSFKQVPSEKPSATNSQGILSIHGNTVNIIDTTKIPPIPNASNQTTNVIVTDAQKQHKLVQLNYIGKNTFQLLPLAKIFLTNGQVSLTPPANKVHTTSNVSSNTNHEKGVQETISPISNTGLIVSNPQTPHGFQAPQVVATESIPNNQTQPQTTTSNITYRKKIQSGMGSTTERTTAPAMQPPKIISNKQIGQQTTTTSNAQSTVVEQTRAPEIQAPKVSATGSTQNKQPGQSTTTANNTSHPKDTEGMASATSNAEKIAVKRAAPLSIQPAKQSAIGSTQTKLTVYQTTTANFANHQKSQTQIYSAISNAEATTVKRKAPPAIQPAKVSATESTQSKKIYQQKNSAVASSTASNTEITQDSQIKQSTPQITPQAIQTPKVSTTESLPRSDPQTSSATITVAPKRQFEKDPAISKPGITAVKRKAPSTFQMLKAPPTKSSGSASVTKPKNNVIVKIARKPSTKYGISSPGLQLMHGFRPLTVQVKSNRRNLPNEIVEQTKINEQKLDKSDPGTTATAEGGNVIEAAPSEIPNAEDEENSSCARIRIYQPKKAAIANQPKITASQALATDSTFFQSSGLLLAVTNADKLIATVTQKQKSVKQTNHPEQSKGKASFSNEK